MGVGILGATAGGGLLEASVRDLPKAELHCHIEGTLEPELLLELAARNGLPTASGSADELRATYEFTRLQDFLDIYYRGAAVLCTERDFRDLTLAYLTKAASQGVRRAEMFFDAQSHTSRGVDMGTVIEGIAAGCVEATSRTGISTGLILCFLRHLPEEAALATFDAAMPFREHLLGVGLDSTEVGHPPSGFVEVFAKARAEGLRAVAHAGEEGPPEYISASLDLLGAERIDHGVRCLEDPALVERLATASIPLTVCPLSNVKLGVVDRLEDHPLPALVEAGLTVTLNSDDPAYFGGYVGDNFAAVYRDLDLSMSAMVDLARASINASFAPEPDKKAMRDDLDAYVAEHGGAAAG
ncbi:MAG: adenosine deaminase [Acidimicrobiia bacterium]